MDVSALLWQGFGAVCGAAIVFVLHILVWVALAGAIQELFQEWWESSVRRQEAARSKEPEPQMDCSTNLLRIMVSDLHFDYWDFADGTRRQAFLEFLEYVRNNPNVGEFYLNGDLMDLPRPPWDGEPSTLFLDPKRPPHFPGPLRQEYEVVLQALRDLHQRPDGLPPLRVCYCTGNHDIGVSGLRYVRLDQASLVAQIIWNPAVMLKITDDHWIYVEHGHLQDPFLWLYLRNAVSDLLRSGGRRQEQQAMRNIQRLDKMGMAAARDKQEDALPTMSERIGIMLAKLRYRHAARRIFKQCHEAWGKQVKTVVFGHTHIPDDYVFPGKGHYFNSGAWAQNTPHQTYLVIAPDGTVQRHEWNGPENAKF